MLREVEEETGLIARVDCFTGVYSKPDKGGIVFTFRCSATAGHIVSTDEADATRYFALDEIPVNILPKHLERIKDAVSEPGKVHMKVQLSD